MLRRAATLVALLTAATGLTGCGAATTTSRVIPVVAGGSIAEAVRSARPGDIVTIAPGTYHESVRVETRDITIRGEDRNAVVLDGRNRLTNGFLVAADGVAIENLTIHHIHAERHRLQRRREGEPR